MARMTIHWNPSRWNESNLDVDGILNRVAPKVIENWKSLFDTGPPGKLYQKRDGSIHIASVWGFPPNVMYGDLRDSLRYEINGKGIDFWGKEYALYLEDSSVLNRPFIRYGIDMLDMSEAMRGRLLSGGVQRGPFPSPMFR